MSVSVVNAVDKTKNILGDKKPSDIQKISVKPSAKKPDVPPPAKNIPPNSMNDILFNGLTLSDLQYGIGKIINPEKDVLSVIAKAIHTDAPTLASKMGNVDALQTAYSNAQFSMGVGFICSGMGALLRLGTNIADMYHRHYDKSHNINKNHQTDNPLNETAQTEQKLHRSINNTADILSSVGGLVTVKNMVHALRTPNVIPQALTAFSGGAAASATTVAAIQTGVGLLAAGVTISSLRSLWNVAKDIMGYHESNTITDKPSTQNSLVSATEQLSKGIGSVILLKNPAGFSISNMLNWDNNKIPIKPLEWLNAGNLIFGGTMALIKR